jgi:hypothetical protein
MLLIHSMHVTGYRVVASFSTDRIVPHVLKKTTEMSVNSSKNSNITENFDPPISQYKAKDVITKDVVTAPIRIE